MRFLKEVLASKAAPIIKGSKSNVGEKISLADLLGQWASAEYEEPLEQWLQIVGFDDGWLSGVRYRWWELKNLDPHKVKRHNTDIQPDNMEVLKTAKRPENIPPIIVDEKIRTMDGSHRLTTARHKKWKYIYAWVPVANSKLSDKEIEEFEGLFGDKKSLTKALRAL